MAKFGLISLGALISADAYANEHCLARAHSILLGCNSSEVSNPGRHINNLAGLLSRYALTAPELKTSEPGLKEFWNLYKNDPHFSGWLNAQWMLADPAVLVDTFKNLPADQVLAFKVAKREWFLKPSEMRVDSKIINSAMTTSKFPTLELSQTTSLTVYDEKVLFLRKGDTVRFRATGSKVAEFRLGKFLGSGNSTQIWEIEGEPDQVLRIPFMRAGLRDRGHDAAVKESRGLVERMARPPDAEPWVKRIKVFEVGDGGTYARVSKVASSEAGDEFLLTNTKFFALYDAEPRGVASPLKKLAAQAGISEAEATALVRRRQMLLKAISGVHESDVGGKGPADAADTVEASRQFLWNPDPAINDWTLVDW